MNTLSNMPIYLWSLFRMPRAVIKRLKKNRTHLVRWKTVYMDKDKCRLDIISLSLLNKPLLCKWDRRFIVEKIFAWILVISIKYGAGRAVMDWGCGKTLVRKLF